MDYEKYLFAVLAFISLTDAVKVDMHGSLSLGKEVLDTFSHYMQKNLDTKSGRRSLTIPTQETNVPSLIIQSTYLCRDLHFCDDGLEKFLNEYILVHTKSVEIILMEILPNAVNIELMETRFVFEEQLKTMLHEIRRLLRNMNLKLKEENFATLWIEVIKRISMMFQTKGIEFGVNRMEGTQTYLNEVKKKLTQKFVIASVIIEGRYESKLCSEYDICVNKYECSKALHTLLESFKDMNDDNMKIFLRLVAESILKTKFYDLLSEVTTNEFQILLNDMAYSDNIPTRKVLLSIHSAVEGRLASLASKTHSIKGRDVELVHSILSDLDHAYSKRNVVDPFHSFMRSFFDWLRTGSRLGPHMRTLLQELTNQIYELSDDLILKLKNEVRVFLELTVDPEK